MTDRQTKTWNRTVDAILGSALGLAITVGGYYVNQMDKRATEHEAQIDDHSYRIRSNEKDIEYAIKRFENIDENISKIDKKLDTLIEELRK